MSSIEPPQDRSLGREEPGPRASRAEVNLTCEIRQGTRPWATVQLHDISETGFRIDWRPGFDQGKPIPDCSCSALCCAGSEKRGSAANLPADCILRFSIISAASRKLVRVSD